MPRNPPPYAVVRPQVPLSSCTSLGLGGPARAFADVADAESLVALLRWASDEEIPVFPLAGGSNVVIADAGVDGLVLRLRLRGVEIARGGRLTVAAGESWDACVRAAVERDLAGIECLSGIPGLAGSTPIQNVGAYGQEVADTVEAVQVLDRQSLQIFELPGRECGFAYRSSVFKRTPGRYVVLGVKFALVPGGAPRIAYAELAAAMGSQARPSLAAVRAEVLRLRAAKSMLGDPADENGRSVGSFFTNPVVPATLAERVAEEALRRGVLDDPARMPRYPTPQGVKLAAGWLIERAGIRRGYRRGGVGISSRHALALVHHGQGTTAELLALAAEVRQRVVDVFGVALEPEPVLWGAAWPWEASVAADRVG